MSCWVFSFCGGDESLGLFCAQLNEGVVRMITMEVKRMPFMIDLAGFILAVISVVTFFIEWMGVCPI